MVNKKKGEIIFSLKILRL